MDLWAEWRSCESADESEPQRLPSPHVMEVMEAAQGRYCTWSPYLEGVELHFATFGGE